MGLNLKGLEGKSAVNDINVTPLIDVVLVLLIIFMVLTPIVIEEMAVNLPKKTETRDRDDVPSTQLLAAACGDQTFSLNRKILEIDELREEVRRGLRKKKRANETLVVFVDGHPDAAYDDVVTLMDTIRDAGAEKIGIAKLKEDHDFIACTAFSNDDADASEAPATE